MIITRFCKIGVCLALAMCSACQDISESLGTDESLSGGLCENDGPLFNAFCKHEASQIAFTEELVTESNDNYLIAASDGFMYKADEDGVNYRRTYMPWYETPRFSDLKGNARNDYGSLLDIEYDSKSGILMSSADFNQVFFSFDRGRTWHLNRCLAGIPEQDEKGDINTHSFTGIAGYDGRYMVVASNSTLFIGEDPLGPWRRYPCEDFVTGCDNRAYFIDIEYAHGFWILYSRSSVRDTMYSNDDGITWQKFERSVLEVDGIEAQGVIREIRFLRRRWYILITDAKLGRLLLSNSADPREGFRTLVRLDTIAEYAESVSSFDIDFDTGLIGFASPKSSSLVYYDGKDELQDSFTRNSGKLDVQRYGGIIHMDYTNGTWRYVTNRGYVYYTSDRTDFMRTRISFDQLNRVVPY